MMENSTAPWKPCPRCLAQMPGEREICEACDAKDKGLPPPEEKRKFVPRPINDLAIGERDANVVIEEEDLDIPPPPMPEQRDVSITPPPPYRRPAPSAWSGKAIASVFFAALLGPVGVLMAVYALKAIYLGNNRLKGAGFAWLAIVIGVAWLLVAGMWSYIYFLESIQSMNGVAGPAA